ncbi:MAG: GGDEF domain-containing protein [Betaproteobacteria bacterium]
MELDARSLIVSSLLSAGLMGGISVAFAAVRGPTRIVGAWGAAILALTLGLLLVALRGSIPDWASIVVGNTVILSGWVIGLRSLRLFLGSAPRDRLGWSLVAAASVFMYVFSEIRPNTDARVIAINTAMGSMAAIGAWLLHRRAPPDARLSCRFAELVFWTMAAVCLLRVVVATLHPPRDLLAPQPLNAGVFLFYTAFIIVATLAVISMEIESLQSALFRAARFDSLTGLHNRGTFLEEFAREEARASRGGPAFSLVLFDLDRFKQVNDLYGHPAGDAVLKAFADVLRATIRPYDTVGRYGGEEFSLLMPQTGKDTAVRVAERVRRELEVRGVLAGGKRIDVTVSAGVACYGVDGADWDTLLSSADNALYVAKKAGRNRVQMAGVKSSA